MSEDADRHPDRDYLESTVGALIFNKNGELFLMRSPKWSGLYCLPGGHIEWGETIVEAVRREVKEETNLDVEDLRFHSIQEAIESERYYQNKHFIFIDFVCSAVSDEVVLNEEGTEYAWVDPGDIDRYEIEPYTYRSIVLYLEHNTAPERYLLNRKHGD